MKKHDYRWKWPAEREKKKSRRYDNWLTVEKLSIPFTAVYLSSLLALPCVAQACCDVFMMSQMYEKQKKQLTVKIQCRQQ